MHQSRFTCCIHAPKHAGSRKLIAVPFLLTAALASPLVAQGLGGLPSVWGAFGEWLWLVLGLLAALFAVLHWRSTTRTAYSDGPGIPLIIDLETLPASRPQLRSAMQEAPPPPPRESSPEHKLEPVGDTEQTISFNWSAELPMEILPGKLEMLEDGEAVREIQFIRTMSGPLEFTIGRSAGAPDRHIRLDVPTVSRLHAHMRLERGRGWLIANRSATNPVRLNGQELKIKTDYQALADGDLIQIGQVFLRFRN